jgi:Protein of unknown function (DUF2752)
LRSIPNTRESNGRGRAEAGLRTAWFGWRRPRSYWAVVAHHLPWAALSGAALLLPHGASLDQLPLLPCTFLHLTGRPCPFCGFTRSFWALSTGHWRYALTNCPLALGVFLCVAILFVWNAVALAFGVVLRRGPKLQLAPTHRRKTTAAIFLLFLLNWTYRLAMGLT